MPFKLGLDLQGGVHLTYKADLSAIKPSEINDAMEGLRDVIERRVNAFGVGEPLVQVEKSAGGDQRLIVELPGRYQCQRSHQDDRRDAFSGIQDGKPERR